MSRKRKGVFKSLSQSAVLLVVVVRALMAPAIAQNAVLDEPFPYQASDLEVRQVLNDVSRRTGLTAKVSEGVRGQVTIDSPEGTVRDVLDEAAMQSQGIWWFDGVVLHMEATADITTVIVDPKGLSLETILRELETLSLRDDRFPILSTADGAVLRVSGPRGYVEQVVLFISTLIEVRRSRTVADGEQLGIYLPRIYHGRRLN